jgi:hypothetical protein
MNLVELLPAVNWDTFNSARRNSVLRLLNVLGTLKSEHPSKIRLNLPAETIISSQHSLERGKRPLNFTIARLNMQGNEFRVSYVQHDVESYYPSMYKTPHNLKYANEIKEVTCASHFCPQTEANDTAT